MAKRMSKAEVKAAADRAEARTKKANGKSKPKPEVTTEPEQPPHRMIGQNDLRKLLRTCASHDAHKDQVIGEMRSAIAYAVEKKYLDKKAFALLRRFDKMETEDLARLWDTLNAYMKMAGLFDRIESVPELPMDDTGETTQPEPTEENVVRIHQVEPEGEKIPA